MFIRLAVCVWSTRYIVTRIHASSIDTSEDIVAIVVRRTFVLSHSDSSTTTAVRIAHCSLWTLANVITLGVNTVGTVTTGIISTLVHVHTTVLRITFVTSLAHTPRWIAWCTFCVYTAWEPVTRIWKLKREHVCVLGRDVFKKYMKNV